jgi:hypothetical protein
MLEEGNTNKQLHVIECLIIRDVMAWILNGPPKPHGEGLGISMWCYWRVVEPLEDKVC